MPTKQIDGRSIALGHKQRKLMTTHIAGAQIDFFRTMQAMAQRFTSALVEQRFRRPAPSQWVM